MVRASPTRSMSRTTPGRVLMAIRRMFEVLTERCQEGFQEPLLRIFRPAWGYRLSAAVTIPIVNVNQLHASATNESGVFTGVGRERHRWGASCIAHAHWHPLPPCSCVLRLRLVDDEALILLSEVFFRLWRHTGSFEVAFPQLALPGAAFAAARRLLA